MDTHVLKDVLLPDPSLPSVLPAGIVNVDFI